MGTLPFPREYVRPKNGTVWHVADGQGWSAEMVATRCGRSFRWVAAVVATDYELLAATGLSLVCERCRVAAVGW